MGVLDKWGAEPHPALPRGYLSFSQISKYLRCAKQYEFHYLLNDRSAGSISMSLGKAVHAVTEEVHKLQLEGIQPALEDVLTMARRAADHQVLSEPWDIDAGDALDGLRNAAESCILTWWQRFGHACKPIHTEREILHIFKDRKGRDVPVLAYVDLEHETPSGPEVLDYKTVGRAKASNFAVENLQLWLYSIMTNCDHVAIASIVRPKGNIESTGTNVTSGFSITRHKVTEAQQGHAKAIIMDVVEGIEAASFPRCLPGEWNCTEKWCSHFHNCRGDFRNIAPPPLLAE